MAPGRLESPPANASHLPSDGKSQPQQSLSPASDEIYGHYHPVGPDTLNLESNFGPMEPGSVGYLQPTSIDTPLEIMHERFERDGYLFVSRARLIFHFEAYICFSN